MNKDGISMKAD